MKQTFFLNKNLNEIKFKRVLFELKKSIYFQVSNLKNFFIVLLIANLILITSCKKEDEINVFDTLTKNTWVYDTSRVINFNDSTYFLIYSISHYSFKNSELIFNTDGSYNITGDNLSQSGIWELVDNGKIIFDRNSEETMEWAIKEIDNKKVFFQWYTEGEFFGTTFNGTAQLEFYSKS